jgi:hypothetical protein
VFARVATFEGIDIEAAEQTFEEAGKRLRPLTRTLAGWLGAMDLADRKTGKVLGISLFDTEENMQSAEPVFDEEIPRLLGDLMAGWSGRRVGVEHYEVVLEARPDH